MSKNNKEKNIKRKIDDETVEQLVENRFIDDDDDDYYIERKVRMYF